MGNHPHVAVAVESPVEVSELLLLDPFGHLADIGGHVTAPPELLMVEGLFKRQTAERK